MTLIPWEKDPNHDYYDADVTIAGEERHFSITRGHHNEYIGFCTWWGDTSREVHSIDNTGETLEEMKEACEGFARGLSKEELL